MKAFRKYIGLLLIPVLLLTGCAGSKKAADSKFRVLTSFYPMYIMAMNIMDGAKNTELKNLASPQTGCLHDYQLRPQDVVAMEESNVFLANGGGMETFLSSALREHPSLHVIYATEDIPLLKSQDSHEEHEVGPTGDEVGPTGDEVEPTNWNAHSWMNMELYATEVINVADKLAEMNPENAELYRSNARNYADQILELSAQITEELMGAKAENIVILHDAFAYFADEFGLYVVDAIEVETDAGMSARQIRDLIKEVEHTGANAIFAEKQYSGNVAQTIAEETGIKAYTLDSCVTGEQKADSYLKAMKENAKVLKEALRNE